MISVQKGMNFDTLLMQYGKLLFAPPSYLKSRRTQKFTLLLAFQLITLTAFVFWMSTLLYAYFLLATDSNPAMRLSPVLFVCLAFRHGWKLLLKAALIEMVGSFFLWVLPLALWNRRADRLNREANPPQPACAVDTGVWPPPPNAPEQRCNGDAHVP